MTKKNCTSIIVKKIKVGDIYISVEATTQHHEEAYKTSDTIHDHRFSSFDFIVNEIISNIFKKYIPESDHIVNIPLVGNCYMITTISDSARLAPSGTIGIYPTKTPLFKVYIEFIYRRIKKNLIMKIKKIGCCDLNNYQKYDLTVLEDF